MALIDKLTNIADKIRTIYGSSDGMSLTDMSDNLGEVANTCDAQYELIQQIKTALEGKSATGGGSSGAFEVTEGTITPATASQILRIPWEKETLPLFYVVMRQDFDTYVTPDNPATGPVLGCIVQFASGYCRTSSSSTERYLGAKFTATTGYAGYTGGVINAELNGILTADGLLADTRTSTYKWQPDVTYKYYIFDKVVQ